MNDHITLRDAMETAVWMMVYAAEPERNIDVTMTYSDLFHISLALNQYRPKPNGEAEEWTSS